MAECFPASLLGLLFVFITLFDVSVGQDFRGAGISALFPDDAGYDAARQAFNLRFDIEPAAIVFPATAHEVSEVVKLGAAYGLTVSARSGGHNYIANGLSGKNGSLVVDLSRLKSRRFNAGTKTLTVETGNRLGEIAEELAPHGRAFGFGSCAYVGIGGHASFGGFGFTSRMWGLALDSVIRAKIVLANGTLVEASDDINQELFWGIRGSAGSFGIVTEYEFATFPVPPSATIFSYSWHLEPTTAARAVLAFQSFVQNTTNPIPATLGGELVFTRGSALGMVNIGLSAGWYGPPGQLNATIAPFLDVMPAFASSARSPGTFHDSVVNLAGGSLNVTAPDGTDTFYAKSLMTEPLGRAALEAFFGYLASEGFETTNGWFLQAELYGGTNSAINRVPLNATAFAHRSSLFTLQLYSSSPDGKPPYPQAGFDFVDGMVSSIVDNSPSDTDFGAYPNYIDDRLIDWQHLYFGSNYQRLQALKRAVDPHNVFEYTTSIEEP